MRQALFRLLRIGVVVALCFFAVLWSLRRLSGDSGLIEIGDDEVAVVYNQWDGSTRQIDTPGNEVFLPFVERIYLQRRSPKRLLLAGLERTDGGLVPEIRLRASDGSLVRFESLAVQYALRPDSAQLALEDLRGAQALVGDLLEAHTRSIVRDEYGRFSAEEILFRDNQNQAHALTLFRLAEALAPHGIDVLELSTPKLRFDSAYEKSVEDRKLANQEVERLKAEYRQLEAERAQRLAALEKNKLIERNQTQLQIGEYLAAMEKDAVTRRAEADRFYDGRLAEAANRQYQLSQEALTLSEQATRTAAIAKEEIESLVETGDALLREAWAERLSKTTIRIQPFSRDPNPAAIELIQTAMVGKP